MTGPTADAAPSDPKDIRRKDNGVRLGRFLRLAPWRVRERIVASVRHRVMPRIAPERRLRVARRLAPLAYPPQLPTRRVAVDAPTMRVRTGDGWVVARRDAAACPASVRRDNLDKVVAALDAAGVDWFRVPTAQFGRTAVAVPDTDRARVLALLAEATSGDHGMLQTVAAAPGEWPGGRARRRRDAHLVRVCWPVTDPHGRLLLGPDFGCEVEFWRRHGDTLVGPRPNPVADVVALDEPVVTAPEAVFSAFSPQEVPGSYRTREIFTLLSPERVNFPIDVVYTWVDGGDPAWQARKAQALTDNAWVAEVNVQTANDSRFACRDELRYSMRSLHCFAPWVRRVFLVTDDQVPAWLDTEHGRVTVVSHREIFGDTGRLPTFNSQAIESRLHRIPGLAEHFLYLNDDVFFGRPVTPEAFFTPGGLTRFFPSRALVDSAPRHPADLPVNSAGKNNRALIRQAFGRVLTRKMMHTPHPSRRSVIAEIEQRFGENVTATAAHQFRHPDDISLLTSLQQYYAYLTGRATVGEIRYMYSDLADPAGPFRLAKLLRDRHLDVFCLNDTNSDSTTAAEQAALLGDFLPAYLPFQAPFELANPRPATAVLPRPPAGAVLARQATRDSTSRPPAPQRQQPTATPIPTPTGTPVTGTPVA